MKFEVTEKQQEKLRRWLEEIKPDVMKLSKPDPFGENEPYYGAIGGGLTYEFTPTGIGDILIVRETYTQKTLNLTDYDSW